MFGHESIQIHQKVRLGDQPKMATVGKSPSPIDSIKFQNSDGTFEKAGIL